MASGACLQQQHCSRGFWQLKGPCGKLSAAYLPRRPRVYSNCRMRAGTRRVGGSPQIYRAISCTPVMTSLTAQPVSAAPFPAQNCRMRLFWLASTPDSFCVTLVAATVICWDEGWLQACMQPSLLAKTGKLQIPPSAAGRGRTRGILATLAGSSYREKCRHGHPHVIQTRGISWSRLACNQRGRRKHAWCPGGHRHERHAFVEHLDTRPSAHFRSGTS